MPLPEKPNPSPHGHINWFEGVWIFIKSVGLAIGCAGVEVLTGYGQPLMKWLDENLGAQLGVPFTGGLIVFAVLYFLRGQKSIQDAMQEQSKNRNPPPPVVPPIPPPAPPIPPPPPPQPPGAKP